jgi:hypothetical protein
VAVVTGPRDEELDCGFDDDRRHASFFGFGLSSDVDEREEFDGADELDEEEGDAGETA